MKTRMLTSLALAAALLASTACGARRPPTLPPAPGSGAGSQLGVDGTQGGSGANGGVTAGSRADFIQSVPAGDRVFFELDSYTLTAEARSTLDAQAQWLSANARVPVTLEGHADERGTREYNIALGERRANAVRLYLESRGVAPSRMQTISYGKERPEVAGSDDSSHARNRRSVTVVPE